MMLIHVFLDNARYHHAKLVQHVCPCPGRLMVQNYNTCQKSARFIVPGAVLPEW
jgi:hypothetical protein